MFEEDIPKILEVGKTYPGKQVTSFLSEHGNTAILNESGNIVDHLNYYVKSLQEGSLLINQEYSCKSLGTNKIYVVYQDNDY